MRTVSTLEDAGVGVFGPPAFDAGRAEGVVAAVAEVVWHGQQH
jgi:hypothetical protein